MSIMVLLKLKQNDALIGTVEMLCSPTFSQRLYRLACRGAYERAGQPWKEGLLSRYADPRNTGTRCRKVTKN